MTLIAYRPKIFSPAHAEIIEHAVAIIQEMEVEGIEMNLRGLHYQFVARRIEVTMSFATFYERPRDKKAGEPAWVRGPYPNTFRAYKNLGDIINDARMAGEVSWEALEDTTRNMVDWQHFEAPLSAIQELREDYRIDRWDNQPKRPIMLIEKNSMVGTIRRVCAQLDMPFLSTRGYCSATEAWVLAQRVLKIREGGQEEVILDGRDHDPSGLDMTRDLRERLELFVGGPIDMRRIFMNFDQVQEHNPPPNVAKETDVRLDSPMADDPDGLTYRERFGPLSWEMEAMPPRAIVAAIREAVEEIQDPELWQESRRQLQNDWEILDGFIQQLEAGPTDEEDFDE